MEKTLMSNIEEYEQYYLYNEKLESNILKKHGLDGVRLCRVDYSDYGISIFDWHDGDLRTRTLTFCGEKGQPSYTYEGNRDDLVNEIEK